MEAAHALHRQSKAGRLSLGNRLAARVRRHRETGRGSGDCYLNSMRLYYAGTSLVAGMGAIPIRPRGRRSVIERDRTRAISAERGAVDLRPCSGATTRICCTPDLDFAERRPANV